MHQTLDLETAVKSYRSLVTLLVLLVKMCPNKWLVSSAACVSGFFLHAAEKWSDFSRLVARRNVSASLCASEKRGKLFPEKKHTHTCGSGSLSPPTRYKNGNLRGRTVGDRLKCAITGVLVRSPYYRSWCAKILISQGAHCHRLQPTRSG